MMTWQGCYDEGLGFAEAAIEMNCSKGTAAKRLKELKEIDEARIAASKERMAAAEAKSARFLSLQARNLTRTRKIDETRVDVVSREEARIRHHERRTHLGFTPRPYTPEEWQALCDRHDNRCARCGSDEPLTVDHIIPVSKGGLNNIENIQPLCRSCNSSKGVDDTDYRK